MNDITKIYKNIIINFIVYFDDKKIKVDAKYLSHCEVGSSLEEVEKIVYDQIDNLVEKWEALNPGTYKELSHALTHNAVESDELNPVATEIIVKNFIKKLSKLKKVSVINIKI
jgi:hypothetical protein